MKIFLIILISLVILGGGAAGLLYYKMQEAGREAAELTAPVQRRDLPVEEIRTKLQSGNFREKLEAKKQINKLEAADRRAVLQKLLEDKDVATRLIAVGELGKLGEIDLLKKVTDNDADDAVRSAARSFLPRSDAPSPAVPAEAAPVPAEAAPAEAAPVPAEAAPVPAEGKTGETP